MPINILLVDDHKIVRQGVRAFLHTLADIQVVAEADSRAEAVAAVEQYHPDVVLMDLEMPGIGGLAAIRRIKALVSPPAIVVVTLHDSDEMRREAAHAGADAFVSKSRVVHDLLPTLAALFPGKPAQGEAAA